MSKASNLIESMNEDGNRVWNIQLEADSDTFFSILDMLGAMEELANSGKSTELKLVNEEKEVLSEMFFDGGGTSFLRVL